MKIDEVLGKVSPEQIEEARSLKTAEELVAFFKSDGIELTEEQLGAIAGGSVAEWLEGPKSGYNE